MAAQEKAKQASHAQKPAAAASQPLDLLSEPNVEEKKDEPPPPSFDEAFVPPPPIESVKSPPPPSFDVLEQQQKQQEPPPPSFDTIEHQVKPPPAAASEPTMAALPAMSAPSYEDLLDHGQPQSTLEGIEPLQAPTTTEIADDDDILNIPGLSPEERQALMDEQRRIMEQIEQERAANEKAIAAARAESFDQRSNASVARAADGGSTAGAAAGGGNTRTVYLGDGQEVALHGQERTKAAIAAGTAILVQCIHCQNWMQVTDTATLMYCPVCSVVSPVEKQTAVLTQEEARQLSADRRLAEQLQSEEYDEGEEEEQEEETWWDSISGMFGGSKKAKPAVGVPAPQVRPPARGEVGVTRPPGSPPRSGLMPARTGEEQSTETITFSRSHDEQEGLLSSSGGSSRGLQPARVAEQKPLFSCMVDSVSTAASSLGTALTAQTLSEDKEGNVHGVDASSLLAVSQVSRSGTEYAPLRDNEES
jgi:hypothetical protein